MPKTLSELIQRDVRIIEAGARDLTVARYLQRRGCERFLCLASPDVLEREAAAAPDDAVLAHAAPYVEQTQVGHNNAELLILPGHMGRHLRNFWNYNQVGYVAWALEPESAMPVGWVSILKEVLRTRVAVAGAERVELRPGESRVFVLLRVRKPRTGWAPRYISPALGIGGFLEGLEAQGIRYAVLRWFEQLPDLPPGEDLDLLVADQDVERVERVINRYPGTIPCDLYSASGRPGTNHHGVSYFPPALAEQILSRAELWNGRYRVPSGVDHFLSLAYHAVFHKGVESGIPTRQGGPQNTGVPEHDYVSALQVIARRNGIDAELTLEGLGDYLSERDWQPPHDTMSRLARNNHWLARRLAPVAARLEATYPGLAVFILRQAALEHGCQDEILHELCAHGFTILGEKVLDEAGRKRVRQAARGSNWGKGVYPTSAGGPAIVVAAYDPSPVTPRPDTKALYPALTNERVRVKEAIRDRVNGYLAPEDRCNMLHSTDNAAEAIQYLKLAFTPDELEEILAPVRMGRRSGGSYAVGDVDSAGRHGAGAPRSTQADRVRPRVRREVPRP